MVDGLTRQLAQLDYEINLVTMGMRDLPARESNKGLNIVRVPGIRRETSVCHTHEMASHNARALPLLMRLLRSRRCAWSWQLPR